MATAWRLYRTFRTPPTLQSYKSIATECKSAIYSYMLTYENQLLANANLGSFYRYANSKLRSRSSVGPLCDKNGGLVTDSLSKASLLQQTLVGSFYRNGLIECFFKINLFQFSLLIYEGYLCWNRKPRW